MRGAAAVEDRPAPPRHHHRARLKFFGGGRGPGIRIATIDAAAQQQPPLRTTLHAPRTSYHDHWLAAGQWEAGVLLPPRRPAGRAAVVAAWLMGVGGGGRGAGA